VRSWKDQPGERGAVAPIFALILLILLIFAALATDLGAAWAERRTAQATVDAAVMAAATEYLRPIPPDEAGTVEIVLDYVNRNSPDPEPTWTALIPEWLACTDPARPSTFVPLTWDTDGDAVDEVFDCISFDTAGLLRVRLPDTVLKTLFATIIDIDTISVSATAVAEIRYIENLQVMPFSLPADFVEGSDQCLATPPSGLLPGDVAPCSGPSQGNFGLLDSPWFGYGDPHFTDSQACPNDPNFNTRAPHNLSIGLDHIITAWPNPATLPPDGTSLGNSHQGADSCANAVADNAPYVLNPQPGNTQSGPGKALLNDGFLGDDPSPTAANLPGRLRQTTPTLPQPPVVNSRLTFTTNAGSYQVDNVGLWEYLDQAAISNNSPCSDTSNGFAGLAGRQLTDRLMLCLASGDARFTATLFDSPRFIVVPVLNYRQGDQFGNKWWAVKEFRPVYLQTSWYDCSSGGSPQCRFQPDEFATSHGAGNPYSVLHNPGEGETPPQTVTGGAPTANNFQLMGTSGLIMSWDWFTPDDLNQIGAETPFNVYLYR
jgi:hypothetical protein